MNNLVVTVFFEGSSREYLFTGVGPYKIGGDHQSDITINGVHTVCFEFTLSGGEILVTRLGDEEVSLSQQIIPKYGQILYREEDVLSIHGHQIEIKKVADESTPPPFFEPEFRAEFLALEKKVEARKTELKNIMNDLGLKERQLSGAKSNLETLSKDRHHLNLQIDQLKTEKKSLDGDLKKIKSQAHLEDENLRSSKIELENLTLERQSVQQHIQKLQIDLKQAKLEAENVQANAKDERARVEKIQTEIHHLEGKVESLEKLTLSRSEHIALDEKRILELSREAEEKSQENKKIENALNELKKSKIKLELDIIELNEKHEQSLK
ncbi:MAG: hypothetical protein K2P81_03090 [Bacteriovoracaceae bacterium]|nr:hypothetical protein [Bacteriovoracaceae bacterium]